MEFTSDALGCVVGGGVLRFAVAGAAVGGGSSTDAVVGGADGLTAVGNSIDGGGGGNVADVVGDFSMLGEVVDWARTAPELANPTHSAATARRPLRVRMVVAP